MCITVLGEILYLLSRLRGLTLYLYYPYMPSRRAQTQVYLYTYSADRNIRVGTFMLAVVVPFVTSGTNNHDRYNNEITREEQSLAL